jgi:DNA-binding response OmpR family regulator
MKIVLVIEDNTDSRNNVSTILQDAGYTVVSISRYISILEIHGINPAVAIIDFLLPFGLGDELCFEIKSHELTKHIPVILHSSSAALDKIVGDCKADKLISRPFDVGHFLAEVERLAA